MATGGLPLSYPCRPSNSTWWVTTGGRLELTERDGITELTVQLSCLRRPSKGIPAGASVPQELNVPLNTQHQWSNQVHYCGYKFRHLLLLIIGISGMEIGTVISFKAITDIKYIDRGRYQMMDAFPPAPSGAAEYRYTFITAVWQPRGRSYRMHQAG